MGTESVIGKADGVASQLRKCSPATAGRLSRQATTKPQATRPPQDGLAVVSLPLQNLRSPRRPPLPAFVRFSPELRRGKQNIAGDTPATTANRLCIVASSAKVALGYGALEAAYG
jgi:hypothetical protein